MPDDLHCPICAAGALRLSHHLSAGESYQVWRCRGCGASFLIPQPTGDVLERIYSADYFLGEHTTEGEARVAHLKRATAQLYFSILRKATGERTGDLLEIGCGAGDFLLEAQSQGWRVKGLEISPHAAANANKRLNADAVRVGTVESTPLAPGSTDVAVFLDVIEHVRDPRYFLQQVYQALRPGGVAFIVTPSLDSWSARVMGRNWMEYKVEHLSYFGERSIRFALEGAGLRDVVVKANPKILSLDYIAHHFDRFPVPLFSPMVRIVRRLTPNALAHRPIEIVASGMIVTARKPA